MKKMIRRILAALLMKSTTINVTTLVGAIIVLCQQIFGIQLDAESITTIFMALAFLLRLITTKALDEK